MLNKLSLNTIGLNRIGLNRIGRPSVGSSGSHPYIDPEVLASLAGVWVCDGKTNYDPDRNIIKNKLPGRGGDFEILNAAYKLNSGFGKYEVDFTSWVKSSVIAKIDDKSFSWSTRSPYHLAYFGTNIGYDIPSFKFHLETDNVVYYTYIDSTGTARTINWNTSGDYEIPISYNTLYIGEDVKNIGFTTSGSTGTITQIPDFDGAFVANGVDDIIVSQKGINDMLEGSTEFTIVSMIHQITGVLSNPTGAYTNYIRTGSNYIRTYVRNGLDKTGIYGCTYKNNTISTINNILGDKNDYETQGANPLASNSRYSVTGYYNNGKPAEGSSVAEYWTFISKKALTTDQINQVIASFDLDKHVEPIAYYDVKKQGLTNDTPLADWYLKDYSKNGWNMNLFNFLQLEDSGIGLWGTNYMTGWTKMSGVTATKTKLVTTTSEMAYWVCFTYSDKPAYKVKVSGIPTGGILRYAGDKQQLQNGVNDLIALTGVSGATGFTCNGSTTGLDWSNLVIEQIPDFEGGLVFDGVSDYGQLVQALGLKDYTAVADRAYVSNVVSAVPFVAGVDTDAEIPFIYEHIQDSTNTVVSYSYRGSTNTGIVNKIERVITYQSTYKYLSADINRGASTGTGNGLTIGRNRVNLQYAKLVLWRFLLFKYSMSEFLIERQLKKFKAGTLYPDMIEWRPIVKSNGEYEYVRFYIGGASAVNGQYYTSQYVSVQVKPNGVDVPSVKINGTTLKLGDIYNGIYRFVYTLDKSPQKVDITIDEYIRYEDIVQPYPVIVRIQDLTGKVYSWGDKIKVGTEIRYVGVNNLLPELYRVVGGLKLNNKNFSSKENGIIEKVNVFSYTSPHVYILGDSEPACILSPQKLRIPNESYKILGYIPDLTGKGNHGVFNNFAFTEESGATANGAIKFDGVEDFVTIPTLSAGGKCVITKVNYKLANQVCSIYDQRNPAIYNPTFAIYANESIVAYISGNSGQTYIDGILNSSLIGRDLNNITHNITITNAAVTDVNTISPKIGNLMPANATYANMAMYEFMLFPEIPEEDEIKSLNDVMGIEGNVANFINENN